MKKFFYTFTTISLLAGAACAQVASPDSEQGRGLGMMMKGGMQMSPEMRERMQQHMQQKLHETDKNNDGKISREEFMAQAEARFKKADANSDGQITQEEFGMMREKMMQGRGGMMRGDVPPPPSMGMGERPMTPSRPSE